jgi:Pectate lyase superfamily protein
MEFRVSSGRILRTVGTEVSPKLPGIYVAKVKTSRDPLGQNRIQMLIPQVLGTATSNWAFPVGFPSSSNVPAVGSVVYATFLGGDRNHPVYFAQSWTIPSDTFTDVLDWINAVTKFGADPTGNTDSTLAIQNALDAADPGQVVYLPVGTYTVSSNLIIPPYTGLYGSPATGRTSTVSCGTVLQPVSGFSAGSWPTAAVIMIPGQDVAGFSTTSEEQKLQWLMVQGSNLSDTSNVAGLCMQSGSNQIGRVSVDDINIVNMTGWGFCEPVAGGHIRMRNLNVRGCGIAANNTGGIQWHSSDSEVLFCGSYSNYSDAWQITNSFDSTFSQCHGEHSDQGNALNYNATENNGTVDAGSISFTDFSGDAGEFNGINVTGTGTALPPVNFDGGFIRRPGNSASPGAGEWAGICINGYDGPVNLTGISVYPGEPDGGGSNNPSYALSVINCGGNTTSVTVSGGTYIGATQAFYTDGSAQSFTVSGDTVYGQGQGNFSGSPGTQTYTPGVTLQVTNASGSTTLSPVVEDLYLAPSGALAVSHPDRSIITSSFTPVSGTDYYRLVRLTAGIPVTNVNMWVTGTVKTGGSHGWVVIVSLATGKVVAVSADQIDTATTWHTLNSPQAIALTSQYVPPVTGQYYLGFCIVASQMPTIADSGATGMVSQLASQSPVFCGSVTTGLTTPPSVGASKTVSGNSGNNFYTWSS